MIKLMINQSSVEIGCDGAGDELITEMCIGIKAFYDQSRKKDVILGDAFYHVLMENLDVIFEDREKSD